MPVLFVPLQFFLSLFFRRQLLIRRLLRAELTIALFSVKIPALSTRRSVSAQCEHYLVAEAWLRSAILEPIGYASVIMPPEVGPVPSSRSSVVLLFL